MLNFQGAVYIKNGFYLKLIPLGGSILNVNPGSVLIINQHVAKKKGEYQLLVNAIKILNAYK